MKAFMIGLLALTSVSAFAVENNRAESYCRAGAIAKSSDIETIRDACKGIRTEAEGICWGGALSKWNNLEFIRRVCADL